MDNTRISIADLLTELNDCRALSCFLTESIGLILEGSTGYNDDFPVPTGGNICLRLLGDKIQKLITRVEGGIL